MWARLSPQLFLWMQLQQDQLVVHPGFVRCAQSQSLLITPLIFFFTLLRTDNFFLVKMWISYQHNTDYENPDLLNVILHKEHSQTEEKEEFTSCYVDCPTDVDGTKCWCIVVEGQKATSFGYMSKREGTQMLLDLYVCCHHRFPFVPTSEDKDGHYPLLDYASANPIPNEKMEKITKSWTLDTVTFGILVSQDSVIAQRLFSALAFVSA
jgi:hypothetical protein